MAPLAGVSLREAEQAVQAAHPGWHVWHSSGGTIWATSKACAHDGSGTTLDAPTPEAMDHVIARWEHRHALQEVAA